MKQCSQHVLLAGELLVSNVWMLRDGEGRRFLVDTGFGLEKHSLLRSLRRSGIVSRGDLAGVLLTHRHCDHAGNAELLREHFDCPIYCHERDAAVLAGRGPAPALARGVGNPYERLACRIEDRFRPQFEPDETFNEGEWRSGFRIVPAYGHTEGSVLIYHEPSATLFTGDALLSGMSPFRAREHFRLAVPAFTLDVEGCRRQVLEFLKDPPPIAGLCSGHGPFVEEHLEEKLRQLGAQSPDV